MTWHMMRPVKATILAHHRGVLTPDLCQVCKQHGPGIVTVRGFDGRYFSAHKWPCAEREDLTVIDLPESSL